MLILGNGTKKSPVRRLARSVVETLYESDGKNIVPNLLAIKGMGQSKSLAVAAALERATNMPADFLLRFQQHYEEDLLRLYDDEDARDFARLTGQVWIMRGRPVPKAELAPAGV